MKLKILGVAQDGGVPQINCNCKNCHLFRIKRKKLFPTSLLLKSEAGNTLIDATPELQNQVTPKEFNNIKNLVLTHAHIGHFTGIINFGFEVSNKKNVLTFVSAKMASFLSSNQPWKSLIENNNLQLKIFRKDKAFKIKDLTFTPLKVPHRDELSDTFGFIISIKHKHKILFIPDIKNWQSWDKNLIELIKNVDISFLDGTFFSFDELKTRLLNKIGHPLIINSINMLKKLPKKEKNKVNFIHFNHSNPCLIKGPKSKIIKSKGFKVAKQNKIYQFT